MRYPDFIKIGDTIGITAPSAGITKKEDWLRLDNVKNNFGSLGYKVRETEDVRKCELGRSADAKKRAEEFMELLKIALDSLPKNVSDTFLYYFGFVDGIKHTYYETGLACGGVTRSCIESRIQKAFYELDKQKNLFLCKTSKSIYM